MFWSKIWFFVVAVLAAVAFTIALVLPRPAARALVGEEHRRLTVACGVIGILLTDDARNRVDLAGSFARTPEIVSALDAASSAATLDDARMKQVRGVGEAVMKTIQGTRKPDFAMLVDRKGRVVARVRLDENDFGDVVAGRPLVDDALAGYLRDDLWAQNGTMYFVSASPVVKAPDYVGAVVLGHQVTNGLAQKLVGSLAVDVGFFLGDATVASSKTVALDQTAMQAAVGKLSGDAALDCQTNLPMAMRAGSEDLTGIVARLPGEAAARRAFYSVFIKRPVELGFGATLGVVRQGDLSFDTFPWLVVAGGFVLLLGGGIALMLIESDRPLRRLTADAVRLAKGETERLSEDVHPGKFGSIARSVNIHIDKVGRDARASKKDLEQMLGPAPGGSLGTIDLLATALPSRPGGSATAIPLPPSEFRFGDSGSQPQLRPTPPARPGLPGSARPTPPAFPVPRPSASQSGLTPPPQQVVPSQPMMIDDDDLIPRTGDTEPPPISDPTPRVDPYFKQVFDQFMAVKRKCNEPTTGLTYDKFAEKLIRNRDDLRSKTGCREVRFTVYVKDGKAALKATPVKED